LTSDASAVSSYDIPGQIIRLAALCDATITQKGLFRGGAQLSEHVNDKKGKLASVLAEQTFDKVILQEQAPKPFKSAQNFKQSVRALHRKFSAKNLECVLYQTCPYEEDASLASRFNPDQVQVLLRGYRDLSTELNIKIVPVGEAHMLLRTQKPQWSPWKSDKKHPSFLMTYIASCMFVRVLTGTRASSLDDKEARHKKEVLSKEQVKCTYCAYRLATTLARSGIV
jgi:hypothetical protein